MTEDQLERKMEMLIRADIVQRGRSNARYQAVQDNVFDKVFRGMYAEDIEAFDPQDITNEYKALFVDRNHYSVPAQYVGFQLEALLSIETVQLFYQRKEVATHQRAYWNNKWILEPMHYLE